MLTPDDAPLLAVFAAVVRRGSFTAAAAELGLAKSVVSERVGRLEARCGARLLERTTRRLRLTEAGAEALAAAGRVDDALGAFSRSLDASRREPVGRLRVATTSDLGATLVAPVVARLVSAHPKVRVEVLADDAPRDLLETGVDVAVRMGAPRASSFVLRRLATLAEPLVAAPALARRLGDPERPRDLIGAPWVRHALFTGPTMRFTGPDGAVEEVPIDVRAEANAGPTLLALLLHGAGVGVMPEHALREHLYHGRLARLCPGWHWKKVTLYALTPSRPAQRPALAAFLTMLREQVALDEDRYAPPRA
jgi:DNA-binding transcriptional LysR family regulator